MNQYPILTFKEINTDSQTVLAILNDFANWQQWNHSIKMRPLLFQKINSLSFGDDQEMPNSPIMISPKTKTRANSPWSWSMVSLDKKFNLEWEIYLLATGDNQYTLINCITFIGDKALENYTQYGSGINGILRLMNRDLNFYLKKEKEKNRFSKLQAYIYASKNIENLKNKFLS